MRIGSGIGGPEARSPGLHPEIASARAAGARQEPRHRLPFLIVKPFLHLAEDGSLRLLLLDQELQKADHQRRERVPHPTSCWSRNPMRRLPQP